MKKPIMLGIALLLFALSMSTASAYTNCTPSACPSGYTDNGVTCAGSTCVRNCTANVCGSTWVQVHSDTIYINDNEQDRLSDSTTSYNSSDTTKCYNFTYDSTGLDTLLIDVDESKTGTCDTEMIGGFFEEGKPSTPWYAGISADYLGLVNSSMLNYLYEVWRSWDEDDCLYSGWCVDQAKVKSSILCAPNVAACSALSTLCNTTCYNRKTHAFIYEGYFKDKDDHDDTLYADEGCGDAYMDTHIHYWPSFTVHSANTSLQHSDQSCDRPNEAPTAINANVLPYSPTAGSDLVCNYTYSDPEDFAEQNSSYEWYKNGVNQNISEQELGKGNLTPGDAWYCKVSPSDGLLFGTQIQSANNVTILTTVKDVTMWVNGTSAWNYDGYFDGMESQIEFTDALQAALDACAADAEGYCNISLDLFSAANGTLNVSDLGIYYRNKVSALGVSGLTELYSNGTLRLFEFSIDNPGDYNLTNVSWSFDTGEGTVLNSTIAMSLTSGESALVYVYYDFAQEGYSINVTAYSGNLSSSQTLTLGFTPLVVTSLQQLYADTTYSIFSFAILNNDTSSKDDVSWSLDLGDGTVLNSTMNMTLNASEEAFVLLEYNYSSTGDYTVTAIAEAGGSSANRSISIEVVKLDVKNLAVLYSNTTLRIFEFAIANELGITMSGINFTVDTGDGTLANSTQPITLTADEEIFIYYHYNYSGTGTYAVNVSATDGTYSNYDNITVTIS